MTISKLNIFIALLLWGNFVSGQNENIYKNLKCYFYTTSDSTFFQKTEDEKVLDFTVSGLQNADQCSYFSSSFIVRKGVFELSVSESLPNGKRSVHGRFHKGYSTYNLSNILLHFFEIQTVFLNDIEISTITLQNQFGTE
jgi:hypothetical protein